MKAKRRLTSGITLLGELGSVAFVDTTRKSSAVSLGILGLVNELVSMAIARGQDLLVREPDGHSSGMEDVFEEFERAPEIPLPAADVAHEKDVEGTRAGGLEHGRHLGAAVYRSPGVSRTPGKPRVF